MGNVLQHNFAGVIHGHSATAVIALARIYVMDLSNSNFPNYLGESTDTILSQVLKNSEELDVFAQTTPMEELELSQLCEEIEKCEEIIM